MDTPSARKRNSSEMEDPVLIQRNIPEIFQIFHNVQFNTVQHKKYVKEMKKVFYKVDQEVFRESFTNALHYTFLFGEANGNVDRVLEFISRFCTSLNEDEDFLHYILGEILECVSVTGQGVRSRSCQLLGLILTSLGEDASLDEDMCGKILSTQLDRLQDVRGAVRCRAVLTLQRLQDPFDEDDPVTRAYIFHMSCDPSGAVRRVVINCLAKSTRNILHILERLCDVDESVRKAAFIYVSSINVTRLKVRQRVHILKVGLTERSPRVRRVIETALVPGWLGNYKGNVLDLLAAIRLDNVKGAKDSALVAGYLLQSLFKLRQVSELLEWLPTDPNLKLIPADQLSKESAWYWRHLARHLHANEDTEHLECVLPELVTFTSYVRTIVESSCPSTTEQREYSEHQHILEELMNIFPVYDVADEVGRTALQTFIYDTLTGNYGKLETEVIRALMRATDLVLSDVHKRIDFVTGIISDIHEPIEECSIPEKNTPVESNETKILRAKLRVSLNEAREEQEEAVRVLDFVLAALCKEKVAAINKTLAELNANLKEKPEEQHAVEVVRQKREDPETLNKCLTILNMMLDSPQITEITPVLRSVFQDFEIVIFQNEDIRETALQTIALYSMLDEEFAKEHKAFFFTQFLNMNNEHLLITALKCVIDIMCVHGVKTFNISQNENEKSVVDKSSTKRESKIFKKRSNKSHSLKNNSNMPSSEDDSDENDDNDAEDTLKSPSTHDTIIELLLRLMNSECVEYRAVVVEGFCRLLLAGRLSSSSLISRLLLLWFNPATEEEDTLRQLLGTFFPLFASHVEDAQEQLEAAFLPTLSTLANAPLGSPLAEVDHEGVLKFMIGLTLPSVSPTARNVHSNLCVQISNALERGAELTEAILCRALSLLSPPRSVDLCQDLLRSSNTILETITDKVSYRNITRFQASLSIAIEAIEQRTSTVNDRQVSLPVSEPSEMSDTNRDSRPVSDIFTNDISEISRKPSSIGSDETEVEATLSRSKLSICSSKSTNSLSPITSPPKKKLAITASDVAKRAIRSSVKPKTPKVTNKDASNEATPDTRLRRSTREASVKKINNVVKSTPVAKKRSMKALGKQLNKIDLQNEEKRPAKKNNKPVKPAATKKNGNKNKVAPVSQDSSSSESETDKINDSSDEETVLHTICHDATVGVSVLNDSSSEDEPDPKIIKKQRPNITIPPSDSSDELFSSDEDDSTIKNSGRISIRR